MALHRRVEGERRGEKALDSVDFAEESCCLLSDRNNVLRRVSCPGSVNRLQRQDLALEISYSQ